MKESILNNESEPTNVENQPAVVVASTENIAQEAGKIAPKSNDETSKTPVRVKRYRYGDGDHGDYSGYGMEGYVGYGIDGYGSPYKGGSRTVIIKKIIIRGGDSGYGGGYGAPYYG